MTTYNEAIDDIFTTLSLAWTDVSTGAVSIVGYEPEIRWPGVQLIEKPDNSKYWAKAFQETISDNSTAFCYNGVMQYTNEGVLFFDIYCPMSVGNGTQKGRELSEMMLSALRGKRSEKGVVFKNPRISELTPIAHFYRFSIISEYEFDNKE
jgi:hypothetical protein